MSSSPSHSSSSSQATSTTTKKPLSDVDTSVVTSSPTPSPTSSHQTSSSHSASSSTTKTTVVSITVVKPSPSTIMSIVTVPPDSTLSSAVPVTLTGVDGRASLTTPPVITLVSTSTEPNGSVILTTHVVANPVSNPSSGQSSTRTGLLHNEGALAGIFVVVGVLIAFILGIFIWLMRKKRKMARQKAWINSLRPQQRDSFTHNPFQDPGDDSNNPPFMRAIHQGQGDLLWGQSGGHANNRSPDHSDDHSSTGLGHATTPMYPDTYPILRSAPAGNNLSPTTPAMAAYPVTDAFVPPPGIGYGYAMERSGRLPVDSKHLTRPGPQRTSTPSLYPASLPGDEPERREIGNIVPSEPAPFGGRLAHRSTLPSLSTQRMTDEDGITMPTPGAASVPPRPPRSHLRKSSTRSVDFAPLTPPDSQTHSPTKTPSPTSETRSQDVLTRRTLLDIRSRSLVA